MKVEIDSFTLIQIQGELITRKIYLEKEVKEKEEKEVKNNEYSVYRRDIEYKLRRTSEILDEIEKAQKKAYQECLKRLKKKYP